MAALWELPHMRRRSLDCGERFYVQLYIYGIAGSAAPHGRCGWLCLALRHPLAWRPAIMFWTYSYMAAPAALPLMAAVGGCAGHRSARGRDCHMY